MAIRPKKECRRVSIRALLKRRLVRTPGGAKRLSVVPEPKLNQRGASAMRVMVIVKATKSSEQGVMPSEKMLAEMGAFNEELVKAGIMLNGDGLHPSSKAKRVRFSGGQKIVVDGPFSETKELVAGFWIWQVKSMDEAMAWAKRCPDPSFGEGGELEIRPIFEAEDFGKEYTPELQARDERLRAEIERQHK